MRQKYSLAMIQALGQPGDVPDWIRIFPSGWVETTKYPRFLCDDESMNLVIADFEDRGVDIVVDYEHQTLSGGKAPAAGWIKELEARPDGLWGRVEWTKEAAGYLKNREYRYHSPVFWTRDSDQRVVELLQVSLTNSPATKHQDPLINKNKGGNEMDFFKLVLQALGLTGEQDETKVLGVLKAARESAGRVIQALGLKPETGPNEIETAVRELKAKADSPPPASAQVVSFLGLSAGATEPEILAELQTLKTGGPEAATMQAEIKELKADRLKRDVDSLVGLALKEGKVTAAQEPWLRGYASKDLEGAKTYVAKAIQVVPLDKLPPGQAPGGGDGLTETQLQINKALGVSKEAWGKYGPAA